MPNTLDLGQLVLFERATARILPTHNRLRKNASGSGHPLYLLWSKGPQKDAASTSHAMCCPEIGSIKGKSILITRLAHFPTFRCSSFRKKSCTQKVLGHNPRFWLPIPLPLPAVLRRNTTFQSQNREWSPFVIGRSEPRFS